MDIQHIGIIGAGTMGGGIAQAAAQNGFDVILEDINEEYVLSGFTKIKERLEKRVREGKLENKEKEDIKKDILMELDSICPEKTIFATNTSSISITRLAQTTKRADKFAGMHFMNPAFSFKGMHRHHHEAWR